MIEAALSKERRTRRRLSALFWNRDRKNRRFWKDRSGATAVEFALVGGPFIILLLGIVEVTTSYFASMALDNGMMTVSRQIRTGEIKDQNLTADQFKTKLCNEVAPVIPCDANLYIDVRVFNNFGTVQYPTPLKNGQIDPSFQFDFDPGAGGDIVLARAFYVWHINTPGLGALLGNMAGHDRLLVASQIFRNEPFGG